MKLKDINRTATFAWSPGQQPLIVAGTVAGALDASFSNDSTLDIFELDLLDKSSVTIEPTKTVSSNARFNHLAWGNISADTPKGIIAAGKENGELDLWNAALILEGADADKALVLRNDTHKGSVKGLDFNNHQANLLASGAENGEVFIWDLNNPTKPYSPGSRSSRLEDITSISWNVQVQHILATASSTGYTVVWDLRNKREVMQLYYPGAAPTSYGGPQMSLGGSGRRGISAVVWNPDNATQLITSSEDDSSPVIMMWDLRNAHAPEKVLTGHSKGVLSLSWCKRDSELLLSSGKDNRVLCWNPQTSEITGELPPTSNWAFEVQWCPRNPDLLAVASFDGRINVHSLQSTQEEEVTAAQAQSSGADIFDVNYNSNKGAQSLSLKKPPKWLRRTVGATFDFGGRLVSFKSSVGVPGKVKISQVVSEPLLISRSNKLENSLESKSSDAFCEEKLKQSPSSSLAESWKLLRTLFQDQPRAKLVEHLGISKEEFAEKVSAAIKKLNTVNAISPASEEPKSDSASKSDTKTAETSEDVSPEETQNEDIKPETVTVDETSDLKEVDSEKADDSREASTKDEDANGNVSLFAHARMPSAADFFNQAYPQLSDLRSIDAASAAATHGTTSAPSSVLSFGQKASNFKIYPTSESETEHLVTEALVLGEFESAVDLTIAAGKWADAFLIAHGGSPELFSKTRKKYFEKFISDIPYLRLLRSILSGELIDIVQNADLQEWNEVVGILCAFASPDEFSTLCNILGQRLEQEYAKQSISIAEEGRTRARAVRRNAVLCYLASGALEKVIPIWSQELVEEETVTEEEEAKKAKTDSSVHIESSYSFHSRALQHFIEKVSIFRESIAYEDPDLATTNDDTAGARQFKLSPLYEKYVEYAELLAAQGRLTTAIKYLNLTPSQFRGELRTDGGESASVIRDRLYNAVGGTVSGVQAVDFPFEQVFVGVEGQAASSTITTDQTAANGYSSTGYKAPTDYSTNYRQTGYEQSAYGSSYGQVGYGQPAGNVQNQSSYYNDGSGYTSQTSYSSGYNTSYAGTSGAYQPVASIPPPSSSFSHASIPQPPQPITGGSATESPTPPPIPAARRRDIPGWNDAPPSLASAASARKTPSGNKINPIATPFPNMPSPSLPNQPGMSVGVPPQIRGGSGMPTPPPPVTPYGRPPSNQAGMPPPPRPQSRTGPGVPTQQAGYGGYGSSAPQVATTSPTQYSQQQAGYGRPNAMAPNPYGTPMSHQHQQQPGTGSPYGVAKPGGGSYGQHGGQMSQGFSGIPGSNMGPGVGGPPLPPKSVTPQPKAPTPVKKHPPGDRSHIAASQKPIVATLTNELNRAKTNAAPHQKRQLSEAEKKMNVLFDAMNNEEVNEVVINQLHTLCKALSGRDYNTAQRVQVELHTTKTDEVGSYITGLKWLIDILRQQG